mmetsp:Transcript_125777/g.350457  ORF Transcript_125777/g.350457 Transcript_125777/m.350457 type:complete len:349 (+) Transcript_125777:66-1112(+)|eukprot:CAMPEP_0179090514 /NCGR_PEP_ID=MMETSP0796-20121207/41300_1 /TAXON_ID=73915 /ORGANISM="Pyrodinium bahamense, Strain pbaha01" /LENGTH=348 /DNA_ID=CAMNT_0020788089 /DNA_START=66 /DNA_END=1112 /DNA_ORIENTATION=-
MALEQRVSLQWERILTAWVVFYATGVLGALAIYGLLQERIMVYPYDGQYFTISIFLVFCNRLAAIVFSIFMILVHGDGFNNQAPLWKYIIVSVSNVSASYCQYEALKWVTFPVQMLGKSFKMMPVMCWGMAIAKKNYTWKDWLLAAVITWGVLQFLLFGSIEVPNRHTHSTCMWGIVLLVCFLVCDSFAATMQEKLFRDHPVTKYNQMLYINIVSAGITFAAMLATHNFHAARAFCALHPTLVVDIIELCLAAVAGQWFIYSLVKDFGALILATTLAVRQVVSTLISYVHYHHAITPLQAMALVLVFGALLGRSVLKLTTFAERLMEKKGLVGQGHDSKDAKGYYMEV